ERMSDITNYSAERIEEITKNLRSLHSKSSSYVQLAKLIPLTAVLVFISSIVIYKFFLDNAVVVILGTLYLVIGIVFFVYPFGKEIQTEIDFQEAERELLSL